MSALYKAVEEMNEAVYMHAQSKVLNEEPEMVTRREGIEMQERFMGGRLYRLNRDKKSGGAGLSGEILADRLLELSQGFIDEQKQKLVQDLSRVVGDSKLDIGIRGEIAQECAVKTAGQEEYHAALKVMLDWATKDPLIEQTPEVEIAPQSLDTDVVIVDI